MPSENLYGEPWEPPPPYVVNLAQAVSQFEDSGIAQFLPTHLSDVQDALNWMIERLEEPAFHMDHLAFFDPSSKELAVFEFEYELQDVRESSYHVTKITRVD